MIRTSIKWLLFPGINLHARLRYRTLPGYFAPVHSSQEQVFLDAGCGNGMLTYQAYRCGYRSIGISIKEGEITRNRQLFNDYLGISEEKLSFRVWNLYDLDSLGMQFDQIVCSEVLEHIRDDVAVCQSFFRVLKPSGVLHLCCPNALHPDNVRHHLDLQESGGHVRPGYTEAAYRALLEPIGFEVSRPIGIGGPIRQWCNKRILNTQEHLGLAAGMLLFAFLWPLCLLDASSPRTPYSVYVRARKPS